MSITTRFHHSLNNGDGERANQKDFFIREIHHIQHQPRLHCISDPKKGSELNRDWDWMRTKCEMLSEEQRAASIITPHVIISAEANSKIGTIFANAPHGAIQFDNLSINNLNDTNASSLSFTSNAELSGYLNKCAIGGSNKNKIQICGRLCGDLAYVANCSHVSNIMFTFECSLSPSTIDELDYVMDITKSARSSEAKDRLSNSIYAGELRRPQSLQAMFKAREVIRLKKEQPQLERRELYKWIDKHFTDLPSEQLTALEQEYQQHIARCDRHDVEVKQRWLDRVHMNSPGIRTVIMTVDDATVKITASMKLAVNDTMGISLIGTVVEATGYEPATILFKFDSSSLSGSEIDEIKKRLFDVQEFLVYHNLKWSIFLNNFQSTARALVNSLSVEWKLQNSEFTLKPMLLMKGNMKLWENLQLDNYIYKVNVIFRDGGIRSTRSTAQFDLTFTWQQFEAPPALWELRDKAEKYHPDPDFSFIADDDNCRVEYFIVRHHNLSKNPVIFIRRCSADDNSFSEEVCLTFICHSSESEHAIKFTLKTDSRLAPYVFDQFANHSEDLVNSKKQKIESGESLLTTIINPPSLQSVIDKHFPAVEWDNEYNVGVGSSIRLSENHDTYATQINANVKINELTATLGYGGFRSHGLLIQFDKTAELTIPQFLLACNLSHLVKHFPSLLIDKVRLTNCSMRIGDPSNERPTIYAHSQTGNKSSDLFLSLQTDIMTNYDPQTKEREWARDSTLIKLHDAKLITGEHFSSLSKFGSTRTNNSFVYFHGDREIKANDSLNRDLKRCEWTGSISNLCKFPEDVKIPRGAHFLTVKQQKTIIWTPALQTDISDQHENDENRQQAQTDEQSSSNNNNSNTNEVIDMRPKFDIPTALIYHQRFSSHLAHYLLNFLPINTILFTLRRLSRAHRTSPLLLDNDWWKRRLTNDYGSSVTRWSDATLQQWRSEWLTATTPLRRYEERTKQATNENLRVIVEGQPVWFSAAIHLQTRLNRFSRDIMKQDEPEIATMLNIPAALRYVFLVAPPFQFCSKYLMPDYELWSSSINSKMRDDFSRANQNAELFWFSYMDRDHNSQCVALYSGVCYVERDQHTADMGTAVEESKEDEDVDDDYGDDYDEEQKEVMTLMSDAEENDEEKKIKKKVEIREVQFIDSNLFPIFEWDPYEAELRVAANSAHSYFIKRGVYRYCDKLAQMWNERELALTIQPTKPLDDEDDLQPDVKDDDNNKNDSIAINHHLSPPFHVRYDRRQMRILINELLQEDIQVDD